MFLEILAAPPAYYGWQALMLGEMPKATLFYLIAAVPCFAGIAVVSGTWTPPAGLLIRWDKDTQPQGESVAQWFEGVGFIVNRGHILPPNSAPTEIWIAIGLGAPWRNP
jgi:hypothetical protein